MNVAGASLRVLDVSGNARMDPIPPDGLFNGTIYRALASLNLAGKATHYTDEMSLQAIRPAAPFAALVGLKRARVACRVPCALQDASHSHPHRPCPLPRLGTRASGASVTCARKKSTTLCGVVALRPS